MVQHFYNPETRQMECLDPRMRDWGEYAIQIYDVGLFLGRLQDYAMSQDDDYFLAGPVEYFNSFAKVDETDCFNKLSGFSYQHEWRVAYLKDIERKKELAKGPKFGPYDVSLEISIGSLTDCANIIPSEIVFDNLESVYNGLEVVDHIEPYPEPKEASNAAFYDHGYFGWGDRSSFREKISSIDDGAISGRFAI